MAQYFPWRAGHQLQLLEQGSAFFAAMLTEIDQATEYVLLEVYLAQSGQLVDRYFDHLCQAAQRGVKVAVLLDDFGASGLRAKDRQRLTAAGVGVTWFNPLHWRKLSRNLMRDHRKLLLVDGRVAFTGGFGLTDDFMGEKHSWCELVLRVQGPCVADWQQLFERTWQRAGAADLQLLAPPSKAFPKPAAEGRLVPAQGLYLHAIKLSLVRRLKQARHHIWLSTPYFVPSYRIRKALKAAARRGVQVHLLLPGPQTDHPPVRYAGQRFYKQLLAAGVHIYEYQPSFLHAKVTVCDDWVSIGSCNFDHWGMHWNLEANQEVLDPVLARRVVDWFGRARDLSLWLDLQLWQQRSRWQKLKELVWGWLDALALRFR